MSGHPRDEARDLVKRWRGSDAMRHSRTRLPHESIAGELFTEECVDALDASLVREEAERARADNAERVCRAFEALYDVEYEHGEGSARPNSDGVALVREAAWDMLNEWLPRSRAAAINPALLDAAAEVYAIAKFYADEGDPELLRRVRFRIASVGLTEEQVLARMRDRADELTNDHEHIIDGECWCNPLIVKVPTQGADE